MLKGPFPFSGCIPISLPPDKTRRIRNYSVNLLITRRGRPSCRMAGAEGQSLDLWSSWLAIAEACRCADQISSRSYAIDRSRHQSRKISPKGTPLLGPPVARDDGRGEYGPLLGCGRVHGYRAAGGDNRRAVSQQESGEYEDGKSFHLVTPYRTTASATFCRRVKGPKPGTSVSPEPPRSVRSVRPLSLKLFLSTG
jgi:hypothetical protein